MSRNVANIIEQLEADEGLRLHAYQDSRGYQTIGIGRCIDARIGGISEEEAQILFENDLTKIYRQCSKNIPFLNELNDVQQGVLLNMCFQMGINGLLEFENTLGLIREGDFAGAAKEMLRSKWATQTPERAERLSKQMETGKWQ